MTKVTLALQDTAGNLSSPTVITINRTTALKEFPGSPGPNKKFTGQTMDQALGGIDYLSTRIAQYKQDVGQDAVPGSFHHYQPPIPETNDLVAAANSKLAQLDKATVLGIYNILDIKETTYKTPDGKSHNHTFDDVANGSSDVYIKTIINGLKSRRVFAALAFHDEPAGDGLGGYVEYAAAISHIRDLVYSLGTDDILAHGGFLGMGQYTKYGGNNPDPEKWTASVAAVSNYLGTHRYNQSNSIGDPWNSPSELYEPFWDMQDAIAPNMVRIHGEYSVHTKPDDVNYAPSWIAGFDTLCLKRNVRASCIFDSNTSSPSGGWRLDDAPRRKAFAQTLILSTSVKVGHP